MTTTTAKSSDVRQWARSKGIEVGERGRLSPEVLAAYSAAHGGATVTGAKKAPAKKSAAKKPAAKKAAVKKSPAKKAAVKKSAAKKAPARQAPKPSAAKNPPREATPARVAPAPSERPSFRQPEPLTGPPAVTVDSARVVALEEQIAKLAKRLEGLETAKAAPKRGLFGRK